MSLRSSILSLTKRFHNTPTSMQWMRNISTTKVIKEADTTTPDDTSSPPVMPSVLAAELRTPNELSTSLNAYAGRSLGSVSNPNSAYRRLSHILFQNSVRKELRANMYYEKPNVARRRKNIERNRKLFGAMIRKKVALIMQMKQRGM
ncbi:hypothetical protein BDB01DRAFT_847350 [Pilobolus umbonatus]|nr:hypothetical protein BDB01DRAFT_847350 [Pilobolus umbonatus]